ncbi:MAG: sigma-70 family RNA polymerase sigma factor [Oscillospiraceae bacterium]|nr:sigma-70 family RNA polymerase sigma factor [Oscillospiraceae bacterium]
MTGAQCYQNYRNGDDSGLAQIVQIYKDGLILYLNSYVKDIFIAEELTEETFVKLALKKPRFSGDAAFKTWLYAVARNVALDYLRRNKHQSVSLDECPELCDEEKSLEESYIREEERILLHRAARKLKREYRQILWLIYFEGFSCKEVGKILGKTTHNVETTASRARQALKIKLLEEGYVYEKL